MYIRYYWQENHQTYGHIWCVYTVVANPTYMKQGKIKRSSKAETTQEARNATQASFLTPYCSPLLNTQWSSLAADNSLLITPQTLNGHHSLPITRCSSLLKHSMAITRCSSLAAHHFSNTQWSSFTARVGQNCISVPYMTVCMVIFLLKTPCVHHICL